MDVGLSVYDITGAELVELGRAAEAAGFSTLWLGEHIVLPVDYEAEHPATGRVAEPLAPDADRRPGDQAARPARRARRGRRGHRADPAGDGHLPRRPAPPARRGPDDADPAGRRRRAVHARRRVGLAGGGVRRARRAVRRAPGPLRGGARGAARGVGRRRDRRSPASTSTFEHVMVTAEPVHVPLILGGNTEPALRRAARIADGWFSSGNPTFDEAVRLRDRLAELCAEEGRPAAPGLRADGRARPRRAAPLRRARLRPRHRVGQPAVAGRRRPGGKQARFAEAAAELLDAAG